MGITKTEGFPQIINETALVFKALGHPARLSIIEHLIQSPSCICNDIVDQIPLAQPTISRHLAELKKVGLIQGTIEGKNICYCINDEKWAEIKSIFDQFSIPQTC
ncbi:metalloregulator ArsR/SmtB family transcription factor [Flavobacteriaceae bacterium]|nr:metalloregulator ArsR/SmtB family transcription factor [Flavobacteriaceae bacterium]MDA9015493.1 metalloregulator ArsR/SmtB family transcription factor [Flavobacteriaceae bacterium]MDB3862477.1 metalloregulator ArsR/SmtB family transcription factor [Flavobacteriaceae bacterium]MDC3354189.1 metalloregulator ArsR/SmtB family transcription factor [Flavobacteriaceae bacterium]